MKKILSFFLLITIIIVFSTITYCTKISEDLSNNVFRLHIIPNSNSEHDQTIKLKVRDNILKYMKNINSDFKNIEDCIKYYENNLNNINDIVLYTLKENNYLLPYNITVTKSFFPIKEYDNLNFPSGIYNCLKIELGSHCGQNWWCVLYPNLCVPDEYIKFEANNLLKSSISVETYNIISSNISYRFKLIDFISSCKSKLSNS